MCGLGGAYRRVLYSNCKQLNSGIQLRVQERGAFGVRRVLAALVFTQRKAARTRRTPNAPRRRVAYPFRKGCKSTGIA